MSKERHRRVVVWEVKKLKAPRPKTLNNQVEVLAEPQHVDYRVSNLKALERSRFSDTFSRRATSLKTNSGQVLEKD